MGSILFVLSEEGYWGEECTSPLSVLSEYDVDVATPSGAKPVIDPRSMDPDEVGEETATHVKDVHENDDRLRNPKPLATASADVYDAVVFPGGHGTEWDVNQDHHARTLLREQVAGAGGMALVLCHAVGLLAFTRDAAGEFLVDGRDVTGFPNAWEENIVDDHGNMPDGRKLPYFVEDEVRTAGADWDAELDRDVSVTVDGDLITGRGPASSQAAAERLRERLGT